MNFIVRVELVKELCNFIKEKYGMHTHTKVNSIIIHYYTYLVIQNSESDTY